MRSMPRSNTESARVVFRRERYSSITPYRAGTYSRRNAQGMASEIFRSRMNYSGSRVLAQRSLPNTDMFLSSASVGESVPVFGGQKWRKNVG